MLLTISNFYVYIYIVFVASFYFILFYCQYLWTAAQVGLKVTKYPILASSCDICFSCFSILSMDIRDTVYHSQKL